MFILNPYAQAGWYNPQNPHSINDNNWLNSWSHPGTFGALPSSQGSSAPALTSAVTFEFTSFNPDVLNCQCVVVGPTNSKVLNIRTRWDVTMIFKAEDPWAVIRWTEHPTIEANGIITPQPAGSFLKLSPDGCYRTMLVDGKNYAWVPRTDGTYLYSAGPHPPKLLARSRLKRDNTKILLELDAESFRLGLLEPCLISTVLLNNARNID
ncbi:hypothetical protein BDZ97DRAFT_1656605 [Flammula alnicola]|nr:hypothetical protein BDZ97DRAFT_1656605 [Flammula alnicola]